MQFSDLVAGQTIKVWFPRGGSLQGEVLEINSERATPWVLLNLKSGARVSVYENEVEFCVVVANG